MDKKSCENCGRTKYFCESKGLCEHWLRNPDLWLDILPTEPGWYWLDSNRPLIGKTIIAKVHAGEFGLLATFEDYHTMPITDIDGQFQGPITPK